MGLGAALAWALLALAAPARSGTLKILAYDASGKVLDVPGLLAVMGRANRGEEPAPVPIMASPTDGSPGGERPKLSREGSIVLLSWSAPGRVALSLPWPVGGDGYSTVWADHGGRGFGDGDLVYLNEEIALTQYRLFKEALERHTTQGAPAYRPSAAARRLFEGARDALARADEAKDGPQRARAFDAALSAVARASEKMLAEHGEQAARDKRLKKTLRYGLTLDDGLLDRVGDHRWIVKKVRASGADWVRLVFRADPDDFTYSNAASFNEYDSIVSELRASGIRVMGCVLDTNQWPSFLTPQLYSQRARNLALHYAEQIRSWEVGLEINGDWLGGSQKPLPEGAAARITGAAAAQIKAIDPSLETVATLYWWDGTAPDYAHSLFGWLDLFGRETLSRVDIVGLSLEPEDNPVGLAFDTIFARTRQFLPDRKLMLSNFGYAEDGRLEGYWWAEPGAAEAGRDALLSLYPAAACSEPGSLGGGFWWQTLDQMLPENRRVTDAYRAYERALRELGR